MQGDTPAMLELKTFMHRHGIADIYMRMLKVIELKRIQGFPDNYILHGPQNEQKKFIGNSVETGVVRAWLRAMAEAVRTEKHTAKLETEAA
jgi:DNA (cytosine-5)-methyltransferase 1